MREIRWSNMVDNPDPKETTIHIAYKIFHTIISGCHAILFLHQQPFFSLLYYNG